MNYVNISCGSTFNGQQYPLEIRFEKVDGGFDITFGDPSWGLVMKPRGVEVFRIKNIFKLWSEFKPYTIQLGNVLLKDFSITFNGNVGIIIPDHVDYLMFIDILNEYHLNLKSLDLSPVVSEPIVDMSQNLAAQAAQVAQVAPVAQQAPIQQAPVAPVAQQAPIQQAAPVVQPGGLEMPTLPYGAVPAPSSVPNPITIPNAVVRADLGQPGSVASLETPPFLLQK